MPIRSFWLKMKFFIFLERLAPEGSVAYTLFIIFIIIEGDRVILSVSLQVEEHKYKLN